MNGNKIIATCSARSNGWAPVLEFPNGGRQMFALRYGTMEEAVKTAEHGKRLRIENPSGCVNDPRENMLMDLAFER